MNTATTSYPLSTDRPIARQILARFLSTTSSAAPLALRLTLAFVIFPHGAQKLLGWFGGYGFAGTMDFFTRTMGLPAALAFGAIVVEFFGPLFLLGGLGTRAVALGLGTVMASAALMVHAQNGFFMNWFGNQAGEGIEYFLLAIGIALTLVISGGGRLSLDANLSRRLGES